MKAYRASAICTLEVHFHEDLIRPKTQDAPNNTVPSFMHCHRVSDSFQFFIRGHHIAPPKGSRARQNSSRRRKKRLTARRLRTSAVQRSRTTSPLGPLRRTRLGYSPIHFIV